MTEESREPLASEALYMFMGWLTVRDEVVKLGATENAAIAAELVDAFCQTNNLPEPRVGWEKLMEHPKEDLHESQVERQM